MPKNKNIKIFRQKMKIKYKELHRVTSTAIIHKNRKYLLLQRSKNKKSVSG